MHVIIHLLTARLPQTKEANYGYKYLQHPRLCTSLKKVVT